MKRFYATIINSKPAVFLATILMVVVIGIADYLTGTELSFVIFYFVPLAFTTWFADRRSGVIVSVLAALVGLTSDFILVPGRATRAIPYWNASMRLAIFFLLVLLLSRLKAAHVQEKLQSEIKSDMLRLVGQLNVSIAANSDLPNVGQNLVDTVESFFPGCHATIHLLNTEKDTLEPLASIPADGRQGILVESLPLDSDPALAELRIVRSTLFTPYNAFDQLCHQHGIISYIRYPMTLAGQFIGMIILAAKSEKSFSDDEIAFFSALVGQAAIALQNARLFADVRDGHARLESLSRRLLELQESERRQIAVELHDEIGQLLTGLNLNLEMIERASAADAKAPVTSAHATLNELIQKVRGLSLDLRPSMLDDLGLLPTLRWHVERYRSATGLDVQLYHEGIESVRFDTHTETAAYRIVQEALTNIARHARATAVTVRVCGMTEILLLEIQDNGVGFDVARAINRRKSVGLAGMRERAVLLGGHFTVDSAAGSGTQISAELPVNQPREGVVEL